MKHRKLRVAWSVAWGIVAVLLVALWVRSYWWKYQGVTTNTYQFEYYIKAGEILTVVSTRDNPAFANEFRGRWVHRSFPVTNYDQVFDDEHFDTDIRAVGFRWGTRRGIAILTVPYWFLASSAAALVAAPWIEWTKRFSLRTLLIATTLVAVGLGIIVWLTR